MKKNSYAKITSVLLVLSMMIGICSILGSCARVKGGTEAARLLLANERLDENFAISGVEIGIPGYQPLASVEQSVSLPLYYGDSESRGTGEEDRRDPYTPAGDESLRQFDSFIINIEHEAKWVAEDIAYMKENVGVVDKWVPHFEGHYMLRVFDTYEVLLNNERAGYKNAYYRYTDENANNIYEMYSFLDYDDGFSGRIKTVFVPGERYEYYFENYRKDGGSMQNRAASDYVIIENSRGYWVLTRFSYDGAGTSDEFCNLTSLMIKDGFIYEIFLRYDFFEGAGGVPQYVSYSISHVDTNRMLVSFGSREINESGMDVLDYVSEKIDRGSSALPCDKSDLLEAVYHVWQYGSTFTENFVWNGYTLGSIQDIRDARAVLYQEYLDAENEVDSVLDYPTTLISQRLDDDVEFADLGISSMGSNSYSEGVISLSGISAAVGDSDLLESGESYTLKTALSLVDEKGNPISVNTVPLKGSDTASVKYSGSTLNLSVSGDFTVPKNLHQGEYALVVYAATADDGIRVSDMVKVASFSTYDESLESAAMDIRVSTVSGNLRFEYAIKNVIYMTVTATQSYYDAEELEDIIMLEILRCGAPFKDASLEYADGSPIASGEKLARGSYRLMCYLNTTDGLAQSYIYLEVK